MISNTIAIMLATRAITHLTVVVAVCCCCGYRDTAPLIAYYDKLNLSVKWDRHTNSKFEYPQLIQQLKKKTSSS